jgi:hypothetical protein
MIGVSDPFERACRDRPRAMRYLVTEERAVPAACMSVE